MRVKLNTTKKEDQSDNKHGRGWEHALADAEADQIRRVFAVAKGNKSKAAKILGIERKTLYRKLEKMGL